MIDGVYIKSAGGRSATVTLLELRERHQAEIFRIKSTFKPGDPKRLSLLRVADNAAQTIRAAEKQAGKR